MPKPTLLQQVFNKPSQSYSYPKPSPSSPSYTSNANYHSVREDMLRLALLSSSSSSSISSFPHSSDNDTRTSTRSSTPAAPPTAHSPEDKSDNSNNDRIEAYFTPLSTPPSPPNNTKISSVDMLNTQDSVITNDDGSDVTFHSRLPPQSTNAISTQAHIQTTNSSTATDQPSSMSTSQTPSRSESPDSASSVASTSTADGSYARSERSSPPTSLSAPSSRATTPVESESTKPTPTQNQTAPFIQRPGRHRHLRTTSDSGMSSTSSSTRSSILYTDDDWAKDVRWLVPDPGGPGKNNPKAPKRNNSKKHLTLDPEMLQSLPAAHLSERVRASQRRAVSSSVQSTSSLHRQMGRRRMSAVWEEDESSIDISTTPRRVHTDPASLNTLARMHSRSSSQRSSNTGRHILHQHPRPQSSLSNGSELSASSGSSSVYTQSSRTVDIPVPLPVSNGGNPNGFTSLVLPRAAYSPATSKRNRRYSIRFGSESRVDITKSGLSQTTMGTICITKNAASSVSGNGGVRTRSLSLSKFSGFSFSTSSLVLGSNAEKKKRGNTPQHLLNSLPPPLSFTSFMPPPSKVSSEQILVQVYAVGLDGLDEWIVNERLRRKSCYGFVPGRSFVGRAVEVGYGVNTIGKGDWLVGLMDARKSGALAEFIVVEKRRCTRCPRPTEGVLTLEQLALLPLCGVPAHRACRTIGDIDTETGVDHMSANWGVGARGKALVIQGQDGAGAMVVQELTRMGMEVNVIVTLHEDEEIGRGRDQQKRMDKMDETNEGDIDNEKDDGSSVLEVLRFLEARVHSWGATVVRFSKSSFSSSYSSSLSDSSDSSTANSTYKSDFTNSAISVASATTTHTKSVPPNKVSSSPLTALQTFSSDTFDAVVDCVGGKAIWVASERVLKPGGQFTTLVGDSVPEQRYHHEQFEQGKEQTKVDGKAVPGMHAHLMANLRSLKWAFKGGRSEENGDGLGNENSVGNEEYLRRNVSEPNREQEHWGNGQVTTSNSMTQINTKAMKGVKRKKRKKVLGYAWVSPAADVDYFGEDVRDTLGDVVKLASSSTVVNAGVRPYVDPRRCVPFERAPMLFSSSFGGGSSGKSYWMSALSGGRTGVVRVLD